MGSWDKKVSKTPLLWFGFASLSKFKLLSVYWYFSSVCSDCVCCRGCSVLSCLPLCVRNKCAGQYKHRLVLRLLCCACCRSRLYMFSFNIGGVRHRWRSICDVFSIVSC